jgi:hypothetical protein
LAINVLRRPRHVHESVHERRLDTNSAAGIAAGVGSVNSGSLSASGACEAWAPRTRKFMPSCNAYPVAAAGRVLLSSRPWQAYDKCAPARSRVAGTWAPPVLSADDRPLIPGQYLHRFFCCLVRMKGKAGTRGRAFGPAWPRRRDRNAAPGCR